jgi:hypothetical protein
MIGAGVGNRFEKGLQSFVLHTEACTGFSTSVVFSDEIASITKQFLPNLCKLSILFPILYE